jgi:hypothetical protein
MATYVSVPYHRWSSRCFQVMALAEEILAVVGMDRSPSSHELERLEGEARDLVAESRQIGDTFDAGELKRIARNALEAAERLRTVIEMAQLAPNHPLTALYEELADRAEVFALSVDPQTSADLAKARAEEEQGESIPWERLRRGA